jgi:nitrite reductase (NADH) small subunit
MEKTRVEVGRTDTFETGRFKIVNVNGREIGVVRLPNGEFRAVRNHCPHKGAPVCKGLITGTWPPGPPDALRYEMEGQVLVCPWHGYEFDLNDGKELFQEHGSRLGMIPVAIEGDRIYITI